MNLESFSESPVIASRSYFVNGIVKKKTDKQTREELKGLGTKAKDSHLFIVLKYFFIRVETSLLMSNIFFGLLEFHFIFFCFQSFIILQDNLIWKHNIDNST